VTGILVHGFYLGGVYYAIEGGMASGIVSLIVGLQPLVTAAAAVLFLKEAVTGRQWLGLALGLVGVALVLVESSAAPARAAVSRPGPWSGPCLLWRAFLWARSTRNAMAPAPTWWPVP
ncbi:EamA family transporter, partial [Marinobacter sp.]|uniref:EamA family transporter n=1 Tax=Marinobacter sp. TaxID=50741 RepID=UPI0035C732D1